MALQPDGRIVAAGLRGSDFVLLRLNPDGTPDPSFNGTGVVDDPAGAGVLQNPAAVVVQADGQIAVAGSAGVTGGFAVGRFNADGSPDAGFGDNGLVVTQPPNTSSQTISALVQEADGKLVVAGTCGLGGNGSPAPTVLRYNADGTPDTTLGGAGYAINYNSTGGNGSWLAGVTVQPDGKIVAVGALAKSGGNAAMLARYNADGTPDGTFGPAGQTFAPGVVQLAQTTEFHGVALDPLGRVVAGGTSGGSFLAARFLPDNALVADPDLYPFDENTPLSVGAPGVMGNDVILVGSASAHLVAGPGHAAQFALHPDGSFRYFPATGYRGPDSFTYYLAQGADTSPPATVTLFGPA